ncbi:flavoprotein [Clostridium felsineum]|uniref:flavoprotein n=1 Tax=Clostridium felsineum TaxID=36839 RepID=UPI00214D4196|nr:flavoprotein [Clostridium felsineum]MCR3759206.1 flavoprotein [Clostridium felsineum]
MPRRLLPRIVGLPYRDFKHKIKLTNMHLKDYYVSDLGGVLFMERRCQSGI